MKVLVIIPAYNEEASIYNTVNELNSVAPQCDYVIINDCSTDSTYNICKENGFNVVSLPINLGIGGAVQTGYKYAFQYDYDYAIQLDGDGQHDSSYIKSMLDIAIQNNADMVIGSRYLDKNGFQSTFMRRVGIRWFSFLIRVLNGTKITDPTSGFRLVNRKVIKSFAKNYPRDYPEPESIVSTLRNKCKIIEIPVVMKDRQGGVSSINVRESIYYMIKVTIAMIVERVRNV